MNFMKLSMAVAVTVAAPCDCVGTAGLPEGSFFEGAGYPANYGSECQVWDADEPQCAEGAEYYGEDWCTAAWCYTAVECESAQATLFFAETEYKDTLAFSVGACGAGGDEEGSATLFASAIAAVAIVAATI